MRRFIVAALVAAIGVAVIATPTSALQFSRHFVVVSHQVASKRTDNGFVFKDELLAPWNFNRNVGRDRGVCKQSGHKVRCKEGVHLDGTIGGYGNLLVKGNFGRGDHTLLVINGNGDFDGVAGKVTVHNLGGNYQKLHVDLVR